MALFRTKAFLVLCGTSVGLTTLLGATSCSALDEPLPSDEQIGSVSSALIWSLTPDQRRAYLYYYAPIIMKSANESDSSHWGYDWITNYDFDRDGQFQNNKDNWETVDTYVANPSAAQFANWKIRPTLYSAAIEYMEGSSKSLTLLYHVYHAKQENSIHDWERVEIRVNGVTGTPGSAGEQIRYVTVTEHQKHNVRVFPHSDLNFMDTANGRHVMIWQAEWSGLPITGGFYRAELHFVENSWATIHSWNTTSPSDADVDVNGTSENKDVHYVFVPKGDSTAVSYWNAQALSHTNAATLAAKKTSTYSSWSQVKRITYELQDLADIMPTHANCVSCGGVACPTENGWGLYSSHWTSPTVEIQLATPITSETGAQLVPASSSCNRTVTFYRGSIDTEDTDEERDGYPHKSWFWGAYSQGNDSQPSYIFGGGAFYDPSTGAAMYRPCTGGANSFWCQHDYFTHSGLAGYTSGGLKYEYGRFLPVGWQLPQNGGHDGRWTQLFDDNHGL